MTELSTFRLNLIRVVFLMMCVFIGTQNWPNLIGHTDGWEHMRGVGNVLLAALGLMALVGIRYPQQMLPILLFEFAWKSIWLLTIALPMSLRHQPLDADMLETRKALLIGVALCIIVIPWRYVWHHYVVKTGERWR